MKQPATFTAVALVLWLASLAGLVWLLSMVRNRTVASLSTAESRAAWEKWKVDIEQSQQEGGPVQRRTPQSDEPPALILLRDRFPVLLAGALVTWTFFYGFTVVVIRGLIASRQRHRPAPLR